MFFIARYVRRPSTDQGWDSLDYCWQMVRFLMNILQTITLFVTPIIFPSFLIKRYIYNHVHNILRRFDRRTNFSFIASETKLDY